MKVADQKNLQEWYILKWDNKYGPFSYLEIIQMLQNKSDFEFDFIWKNGQDNWRRIAEMSDFAFDKIKELYQAKEDPDVKNAFFRRRHERIHFNGSIIIHDNEKVWKGDAIEISEGGAGIVMYNAMIKPGEKVFLHFKPGDKVPPFNAICEVVSKKYSKDVKGREGAIKYGVKFLKMHSTHMEAIKDYIKKKAA
jgi:hypothetical protein